MPPPAKDQGADASDDDLDAPRAGGRRQARENAQEFEIKRSWDVITEGQDGTITGAVEGLLESNKRKRLLKDATPLQRGIIRHLVLILDMSIAMNEKDLRPTRYLLMLNYLQTFITEFFEQNPISQLGIVGMHDGIAITISSLSGNPTQHLTALARIKPHPSNRNSIEPKGNPSLENALSLARASLFHAPSHGTREILLIFGSLHTSDPGDVHTTIASLVSSHIRASVIGLAAQVAICAELVSRTNNQSLSNYHVVLHEQHFRELLLSYTTPPITYTTPDIASGRAATNSLLMMGFPSRTVSAQPTLCACHTRPSRSGYLCSRCSTKVCSLPSECPVCGLTLILSTHLARSYHHLFPLRNWEEVPWRDAGRSKSCFACGKEFPFNPAQGSGDMTGKNAAPTTTNINTSSSSSSSSSRYECPVCKKHFCIDCDLFAHEVVHNCPGCQSVRMEATILPDEDDQDALRNGINGANTEVDGDGDGMEIDR